MSNFENYQTTELRELFNPEVIERTLENVNSLTPTQEAILQFIVNNPDEEFIKLQNTFKKPDPLIAKLVLEYGTPSDELQEIRDLRQKMRNH